MAAVFVNGFDFGTPETTIERHFASIGNVTDVRLIGSGSAVVKYDQMDDAHRAVEELNKTTMEGNERYVFVKIDGKGKGDGYSKGKGKGKDNGNWNGKGYDSGKDSRDPSEPAVFVGGFDFGTPEATIERHFASVGRVTDVRLVGKGSAVVSFDHMNDAHRAVEQLNDSTMEGNERHVFVKLDGKGKGKGKDSGKWNGKGSGSGKDRMAPLDRSAVGEFQEGTVAAFFEEKGFGFIKPSSGGSDVYVHFTAIQADGFRSLRTGQAVNFAMGEDDNPKGNGKGKGGKAVFVEIC